MQTLNRLSHIPYQALPSWLTGNRLKILMYHSVSNNPRDPHAVTPAKFREQMKSLQTKYVVSLMEGLSLLQNRLPLHGVYVITFDDALLDFYTAALPVLGEFHYPSTVFVPTAFVGGKAAWDSYDTTKPLMTWKQLRECRSFDVTFGSHTVTHARLTECSASNLRAELDSSLRALHDNLGESIPALAYPGGYHDARVHEAARASGYLCALTAASRWGNGFESDFYQLRRQRFS